MERAPDFTSRFVSVPPLATHPLQSAVSGSTVSDPVHGGAPSAERVGVSLQTNCAVEDTAVIKKASTAACHGTEGVTRDSCRLHAHAAGASYPDGSHTARASSIVHVHHGTNMYTCASSRPFKQAVCVVASKGHVYKDDSAQRAPGTDEATAKTSYKTNHNTEKLSKKTKSQEPAQEHIAEATMPRHSRRTPRGNSASASSAPSGAGASTAPSGTASAQEDTTNNQGQPHLPAPEDESNTVDVPIPPSRTNVSLNETQGLVQESGRSVRADRAPLCLLYTSDAADD